MNFKKVIKYNLTKIWALTEKNIKLKLRFKYYFILSYISPFISVIIPLFVLGKFFEFNADFGPWTEDNYYIYSFLAYVITLLKGVMTEFQSQFYHEKYWNTLPGLIIAPSNKLNLLLGIFFSQIIVNSVPTCLFFILCFLYAPISIFTLFFVIFIYVLIALIFSGIGLIIGVLTISNENLAQIFKFGLNFFFLFSALTFPFQVFPEIIQQIINLNPFYYYFDLLRLSWVFNDNILMINNYLNYLIIIILSAIFLPSFGVISFNYIYKKYGIVGA